ncbi:MAG: hypothetical protein MPW15_20020 [Candidatus Manganitrophus sp.]|nr:hypothetical protein [Candidatus Manganitrophus sp.]
MVAVAASDAWFSYYYWLEDRRAPDFARTVDIHRKPGYDPVELFIDPALAFPKVKNRRASSPKSARIPDPAGCHSARCRPGQRLPRTAHRLAR